MNAIELYKKYFPQATPNFYQLELIEVEITDMAAWNETLIFWCGNDYRAQSVFKMIEYYKGVINGSNQKSGKRSDQQTIAESADFYNNYPS